MFQRAQIRGVVDVEAERVIANDADFEAAATGFGNVPRAGTGSVRELEVGRARDCQHRISVIVVIRDNDRDVRAAVVGDAVDRGRERKIRVHHDDPVETLLTNPRASGIRGAVEGSGIVHVCDVEATCPRDDVRRARHDHDRSGPGGRHDAFGHRAGERTARVVVECVGEPGFSERKRSQRHDDACSVGRAPGRHGLRMLPSVDPVYSVAKGVFMPWLRWGLDWKIEGAHRIPTSGPVVIASNHVSYLDPLTLAWVADQRRRHVRFLAKAELFEKPGLGSLLRAAHQIPVRRGRVDAADALKAAVDALGRGECIGVFPEGTISQDLEPMAGKSGTARLVQSAGVAITPVGLWGTHRILTKGRRPHWQWGIAQTAVVGEPIVPGPEEHVKQTTDRMMAAIVECVARAREIYPTDGASGEQWWWRDPESAGLHRRSA